MIKVDVVSGFLGAGKTTLIKKLCKALADKGERIVIIENEFGEAGIDGKMLELNGLRVYEIENGCICCTLKADFVKTLIQVAKEQKIDRILIEPSGIFMLSEMHDLFADSAISSLLVLNMVTTVVDSVRFLKQRRRYSQFFESQINYADQIVLSKVQHLSDAEILQVIEQIQRIHPEVSIVSAAWDELEDSDFYALLDQTAEHRKFSPPSHSRVRRHRGFETAAFYPARVFDEQGLRDALESLASGRYGSVLRTKGFVFGVQGNLEFNYVDGEITISAARDILKPCVSMIGEALHKNLLAELFQNKHFI